jgi:hypothetical protein
MKAAPKLVCTLTLQPIIRTEWNRNELHNAAATHALYSTSEEMRALGQRFQLFSHYPPPTAEAAQLI